LLLSAPLVDVSSLSNQKIFKRLVDGHLGGLAPPEEIIIHEPYIGVIVFAENPITTIFYTHAKISTVKLGN